VIPRSLGSLPMSDLLDYRLDGEVAVLTYDDGKANVFGHPGIDAIHEALDRAEQEARALLFVGREGKFSAGFDLSVMTSGVDNMRALVLAGAELALRVLTFPRPTVAACTGHGLAMGAILLLAFDHRVGADGPFKLGMNEVAIGMSVPDFAMELARFRIPTEYFAEVLFGKIHDPRAASRRGYLDEVVAPDEVVTRAGAVAQDLSALHSSAHSISKDLARGPLRARIEERLAADIASLGPPTT
jgi:enoyl-CoA hydratase